jgi:hypothetical protein
MGSAEGFGFQERVGSTCRTHVPPCTNSNLLAIQIPRRRRRLSDSSLSSNGAAFAIMNNTSEPSSFTSENRFSPITDIDKGGILWIASLLAGVYSVLSTLVRFYIKRKCFGTDDWVCAAATVNPLSFPLIFTAN